MKNLAASFFIVPNGAIVTNGGKISFGTRRMAPLVQPIQYPEIMVQVWLHDGECENWSCHGGPVDIHYLPLSLLATMREGDSVTVEVYDTKGEVVSLTLTAKQQGFRYERFGRFEEVLRGVTSNPNWATTEFKDDQRGLVADLWFKALNKESQWAMEVRRDKLKDMVEYEKTSSYGSEDQAMELSYIVSRYDSAIKSMAKRDRY